MTELYTVVFDHYADGKCCVYKENGSEFLYIQQLNGKPPLFLFKNQIHKAIDIAFQCGGNNITINCVGEKE